MLGFRAKHDIKVIDGVLFEKGKVYTGFIDYDNDDSFYIVYDNNNNPSIYDSSIHEFFDIGNVQCAEKGVN